MRTLIIIASRLASTRFPRNAVQDIHGKPVIQRCYEGGLGAKGIDDIYIATPDQELGELADSFGAKWVMTGKHDTMLGRVAEAADILDADIVVCVQGDEPMVNKHMVELALGGLMKTGVGCATLVKRLEDDEDPADLNMIKIVIDKHGNIMYASRAAIPCVTPEQHSKQKPVYYKQSCIMTYSRFALSTFVGLEQLRIESNEGIDIVRFLEHGLVVKAIEHPYNTQSIDVPADLERIRELWK